MKSSADSYTVDRTALANVIEEVLDAGVKVGIPSHSHIKQAFKDHEWREIVAALRNQQSGPNESLKHLRHVIGFIRRTNGEVIDERCNECIAAHEYVKRLDATVERS